MVVLSWVSWVLSWVGRPDNVPLTCGEGGELGELGSTTFVREKHTQRHICGEIVEKYIGNPPNSPTHPTHPWIAPWWSRTGTLRPPPDSGGVLTAASTLDDDRSLT